VPAKRLYQPTIKRVRLSSLPLCVYRTTVCIYNVRNALSYAICVGCCVENWVLLLLDVSLQCRNRISSVSGLTGCELQGRNLIPIRDIGFFPFTTSRRTRVACYRGCLSIRDLSALWDRSPCG